MNTILPSGLTIKSPYPTIITLHNFNLNLPCNYYYLPTFDQQLEATKPYSLIIDDCWFTNILAVSTFKAKFWDIPINLFYIMFGMGHEDLKAFLYKEYNLHINDDTIINYALVKSL